LPLPVALILMGGVQALAMVIVPSPGVVAPMIPLPDAPLAQVAVISTFTNGLLPAPEMVIVVGDTESPPPPQPVTPKVTRATAVPMADNLICCEQKLDSVFKIFP